MTPGEKIYKAYGVSGKIRDKVLEVGLGWGYIADELVVRGDVQRLISYEKNLERVEVYEVKNPIKHTVINRDILSGEVAGKFDVVIIDIFDTPTQRYYYDVAKQIVTKLVENNNLERGAVFIIEYQMDTSAERSFRQWMERRFGRHHSEFVHTGHRASSRNICSYSVPDEQIIATAAKIKKP